MTEPYKPVIWYNETGNILEVIFDGTVAHVAEWVNNKLVLLRSVEDNKVIGLQIWGFRHFRLDGIKITDPAPLTEEEAKQADEMLRKIGLFKENPSESTLPGEVLPREGKA